MSSKIILFSIQIFAVTYYFFIAGTETTNHCTNLTYSFIADKTYSSAEERVYVHNNPGNFIGFSLNMPIKDVDHGSFASQSTGSSSTLYFKKEYENIIELTVYENDCFTTKTLDTSDYRWPVLRGINFLINYIHFNHLDYALIPTNNVNDIPFLHLPNDVTLHMLAYLSLTDLMNMSATTKKLYTFTKPRIIKFQK
ncbi:F-box protein [Candidatus Dependentiae bacterium]|nr:MAG: F-box protein [Candidatus Dependentiae bacterium]